MFAGVIFIDVRTGVEVEEVKIGKLTVVDACNANGTVTLKLGPLTEATILIWSPAAGHVARLAVSNEYKPPFELVALSVVVLFVKSANVTLALSVGVPLTVTVPPIDLRVQFGFRAASTLFVSHGKLMNNCARKTMKTIVPAFLTVFNIFIFNLVSFNV
jgi:hypothetical protein